MKLLKKIGSVFIALCIMLSVICFASAAPASEVDVKKYLNGVKLTDVTDKKKDLSSYPEVVNVLSKLLLDLKVEANDFNDSDDKKLGHNIKDAVVIDVDDLNSTIVCLMRSVEISNLVSAYSLPDGFGFDPDYASIITYIKGNDGDEQKSFYWLNKEKCKSYIKGLIDGTVSVGENDHDNLFLKHAEEAVVKYIGDIDSIFNDEGFSKKFVQSILEIINTDAKLELSDTTFYREESEKRSDAVNDYKKMGQYLVKNTLGYKGLEDGKDYEIEYDEQTGYIKEIKAGSGKESKVESLSPHAQLMNNVFTVAFVCLAVIVVGAVAFVIFALIKRKR